METYDYPMPDLVTMPTDYPMDLVEWEPEDYETADPYIDVFTPLFPGSTINASAKIDRVLAFVRATGLKVVPLDEGDRSYQGYNVEGYDYDPIHNVKRPHPALGSWTKRASASERQIRRWWGMWPEANFGVVLGADMVVIDVDVKDGKAGLEHLLLMIESSGLRATWVTLTPSGGYHVWLKDSNPGELAAAAVTLDDGTKVGWDIRHGGDKGGMIVGPGSDTVLGEYTWFVMPSGFCSHFTKVSAHRQDLPGVVRDTLPKKKAQKVASAAPVLRSKVALPSDPYELLRSGAESCGDVSDDLLRAASTLKNLGKTSEECLEILIREENRHAMVNLAKDGQHNVLKRARAVMAYSDEHHIPLSFLSGAISDEVMDFANAVERARALGRFSGSAGASDLVILRELARIAVATNRVELFCSIRTLASATHKHKDTVSTSLRRSRESHWLRLVKLEGMTTDRGGVGARVYAIQIPHTVKKAISSAGVEVAQESPTRSYSVVTCGGKLSHLSAAPVRRRAGDWTEAFAQSALGDSGQVLFEMVAQFPDGLQTKSLVELTKLSRATVKRKMGMMEGIGVVEKAGDLWKPSCSAERAQERLGQWVRDRGTASLLEDRRKQMQDDQRGFQAYAELTDKEALLRQLAIEDEYTLRATYAELRDEDIDMDDLRVVKGRRYRRVDGYWHDLDRRFIKASTQDPALRGRRQPKKSEPDARVSVREDHVEADAETEMVDAEY